MRSLRNYRAICPATSGSDIHHAVRGVLHLSLLTLCISISSQYVYCDPPFSFLHSSTVPRVLFKQQRSHYAEELGKQLDIQKPDIARRSGGEVLRLAKASSTMNQTETKAGSVKLRYLASM